MLHPIELTCIQEIAHLRGPILDLFFKFLNFFDRQEFFFILIPTVWLGSGWRTGLRLFYVLLASNLVNHALKECFVLPRPFHIDPSLGVVDVAGYGLPSGAAQTAVLLAGLALSVWKHKHRWFFAVLYVALISFSRLYLGVHFPSDVLVGWCLGFAVFGLCTSLLPRMESLLVKLKPWYLLVLSQVGALLLLLWELSAPIIRASGVCMGVGVGTFLSHFSVKGLPEAVRWRDYMLRGCVGALGTFLCHALTLFFPKSDALMGILPRFFLLGIWVSFGNPFLCRRFFGARSIRPLA